MFFQKEKKIHYHKFQKKKHSLPDYFSVAFLTVTEEPSGRTFLHSFTKKCKKAGMVVEAAILLPLFLLAMLTMIEFMDIYQLQTEKLVKLCETLQLAGVYDAVLEDEEEKDLTIPSVYSWKASFPVIPLPTVWMGNLITVRVWNGAVYHGENQEEEAEDCEMVYVTETGKVFHNEHCTYLNLSVKAVSGMGVASLRNKNGAKYYPCERCIGQTEYRGTVFITTYGNRYHSSEQCSALKRTVRKIKRSEAEKSMSPCSKCGG